MGRVSGIGSFIGKVLMANADALCAAATPLVENDEINLWVIWISVVISELPWTVCDVLGPSLVMVG